MASSYDPGDDRVDPAPRRRMLAYLLLPALFFLLGLAAMVWILTRWDAAAQSLGLGSEPPPAVMEAQPAAAPVQARPAPTPGAAPLLSSEALVIDPELARRVGTLEQRLGQVGSEARSASGNADRAEGLLVAFAARRALDRGVSLGFLEALLRQRFGASQPRAVGMIIAAAREPVTLQELQDGLQEIGPQLVGAGPEQGWWEAFQAELGGLITVRRQDTPSTEPAERLRRATRRLEAGQAEVALAEVLRMPGRDNGRDWIMKARRYVAARGALDTIETAALLEPRAEPQAQPQPQPQAPPPAQQAPAPAPTPSR